MCMARTALAASTCPSPGRGRSRETASDLIIRMARENPGEITLCPVGPITNVAIALTRAPEIAGLLREIVVMGSTIFQPGIQGIPTPMADANFWNDAGGRADRAPLRRQDHARRHGRDHEGAPHRADVARRSRATAGHVGATHDGDRRLLRERPTRRCIPASPAAACTTRSRSRSPKTARSSATERMCVDIELAGTLTRGMTVADRRRTAAARRTPMSAWMSTARGSPSSSPARFCNPGERSVTPLARRDDHLGRLVAGSLTWLSDRCTCAALTRVSSISSVTSALEVASTLAR